MREWLTRLRDWFRRDTLDRELQEELRFHHEMLERDARASGADAREARYAAARRFGNVSRAREDASDRWSLLWLDQLAQDVRHALRGLKRAPGFAATVVVTLGLGIGANAAMFGVIDRLMFRPYPYLRDPSTVHRVYLRYTYRGATSTTTGFEYTRYLDLARWSTAFSQAAGITDRMAAIGTGDAAHERPIAMVSASFFDFFDMRPALGRFFVASEDTTPRGADVAVLGYAFWQSEYGGRNVIGEVIQVGNIAAHIVGVAPRGFAGVNDDDPPALYIPITTYAGAQPNQADRATYYTNYNWGWMGMMVRRKPGVREEQASTDLSRAYLQSWNHEHDIDPSLTPAALAKPQAIASAMKTGAGPNPAPEARTALWVTGVALIVLLIACANVANLFLARALQRRREIAVRLALGVSRGRLVRQAVTESLVLAGLGSAVGLMVAQWGGAGIRRLLISNGASLDLLTDWRTIAVATAAALAAGLLTGLVPALLSSHGDLAGTLKAGVHEGTYHRSRTRAALLVVQGALSVVLLVGAGLFVKSLRHVRDLRLGYDAGPVLLAVRNMRGMPIDDSANARLGAALLEAAQHTSGVERATWVSSVPFYSRSSTALFVPGIDSVRRLGRFTYQTATRDYFEVMGTRILRGRGFAALDRAGAPLIAVVSESMARVLWPGKEALGECMHVGQADAPCTTVVGIAEDIIIRDLSEPQRFHYYLPWDQSQRGGGFALLIRMRGDAAAQAEAVRRALQPVMPGQSYVTVQSFESIVDAERRSWRLGATMFVSFGVLALLVAAVGLYGVIAYNVAQRRHELGVRVALGAQRGDILSLVIGQGLRFAAAGVAIGCALAYWAGRFVQPLLFQQSPRDPSIYLLVGAVMMAVALVAAAAPAARAVRADPTRALRAE